MTNYILKPINECTYSLKINGEYNIYLYKVIKKFIKVSNLDYETGSIYFCAENVIHFKDLIKNHSLSHNKCIKLIYDLTNQILYLKKLGYSFYGFDINDILVVDDIFMFCSTQYVLPLVNELIIFYSPIKKAYFSNPELLNLTTLPSEISYKCCYYSLGTLVIYCLLNAYIKRVEKKSEIEEIEEIEKVIQPLYNTKMYWFIKRCLHSNINKRELLLI
jgi:hypothetical protein